MSRIGSKGTPYTGYTHDSKHSDKRADPTESKIPRSESYQEIPEIPIHNRKTEKSEQTLTEDQMGILRGLQKENNSKVFSDSLMANVGSMEQLQQLRQHLPSSLSASFEDSLLEHAAFLTLTDTINTLLDLNLPQREYYNVLAEYMSAPNQVHCPVRTVMKIRAETFSEELGIDKTALEPVINDMTLKALSFINTEMRNVAQDLSENSQLSLDDQVALRHQLQQQNITLAEAMELTVRG